METSKKNALPCESSSKKISQNPKKISKEQEDILAHAVSDEEVKEAVRRINPDKNSMESRG